MHLVGYILDGSELKSHVGNKSDMRFVDQHVVQKNFRTAAKLPFGGKTLWNLESLVRLEMYLN